MLKNRLTVSFLLSIILLVASAAFASMDTTSGKAGFQFLEASTTPEAIAMGNAATALPGAGFSYYNPARPFSADVPSVSIGYGPMPGDLTAWYGEGVWSFSNTFVGMHLSNHSVSGIYTATEQGPNYNQPFSSGFTLVSIDAGYTSGRGALALTVNGMQDRIETSTAYGVSVSVGGLYCVIPEKLTLGAALLHLGTTTGYTDATSNWGEGDRLPRTGRIGAAYTDSFKQIPFSAACDVVYRDVGDKLSSVKNALPRITVPLGVEVRPSDYVAVRLGKRFNFETELVNFGAGLRFKPLKFDMSFVIAKLISDVEVQPMFALTYAPASGRLGKRRSLIVAPEVRIRSGDTAVSSIVKPISPQPADSAAGLSQAPTRTVDSSAKEPRPMGRPADSAAAPADSAQGPNPQSGKELPARPQVDINKQQERVDPASPNPAPKNR